MPAEPLVRDLTQLRELVETVRPVTLAHERTLPVLPALEPLLPARGLRRGTSVRVEGGPGATTLALATLAGPTRAGSWAACVGVPAIGWGAAAELGVALERVAVVRAGERTWATVVAALVDAFDVVLVGPEHRPSATEVRRLTARARERGSVLLSVGAAGRHRRDWPGVDVRLSATAARWSGPGEGWGHLRARRVTVSAEGRGGLGRPQRVDLWLPGPDGVQVVEADAAPVLPLRRRAG